jgi:hypothetical protein
VSCSTGGVLYSLIQSSLFVKSKENTSEARAIISHILSKGPVEKILTFTDFTDILARTALPSPSEQADLLINYLGTKLSGIGDTVAGTRGSDELKNIGARIGSRINSEWTDFCALVVELEAQGLLHITWADTSSGGRKNFNNLSLTLSGWDKHEDIGRNIRSKTAFIAMKFKSTDDLDYSFNDDLLPNYLIEAVRQAGFVLSNPLADNPQAGNLHARLELEIKNARFVVAELSHRNNGAYWEAGFAKGLGKPVIYMYNRVIGDSDTPHFDVGSDQIIYWEKEKPEQAAQSLKGVIRNTLFGEAKQNDDPV